MASVRLDFISEEDGKARGESLFPKLFYPPFHHPKQGIIYILLDKSMTYIPPLLQGEQENSTFTFSLYSRGDKEKKACELLLSQPLPELSLLKMDQYFLQSVLSMATFPHHNLIQEFRAHFICICSHRQFIFLRYRLIIFLTC